MSVRTPICSWPPGHRRAAGDCVVTRHRQLGVTYLPLGTTAHKQGRVAGENALGGAARFAGSLGTQVVKVFDLVAARTGLRDYTPPLGSPWDATHMATQAWVRHHLLPRRVVSG